MIRVASGRVAPEAFVRLRPHLCVMQQGNDLIIVGDESFRFSGLSAGVLSALEHLRQAPGLTLSALEQLAGADTSDLLEALLQRRLAQTSELPFTADTDGTAGYLATLHGHYDTTPTLESRSVMIVGCGGLGGELARHLAASGVGRLVLVDGDTVKAANLNRQYLYTHADLGQRKVLAAQQALRGLNPHTRVEVFSQFVQVPEDFAALDSDDVDAVVCCADTPLFRIHAMTAQYARRLGAVFSMGSVGIDHGSWGPLMEPGHQPSFDAWQQSRVLPGIEDHVRPPTQSFGPTNSFVAGALATDLIHYLVGLTPPSLHCRIDFDFHTLAVQRRPISDIAEA